MTDKEAAAKDWLTRHDYMLTDIKSLEMRLEEMRDSVNRTVSAPKDIVVQTQPRNVQSEKIAEIVDFEKIIDEKKKRFQSLEWKTRETVEQVNNSVYRNILFFRYVCRRDWSYIAKIMHYRESYIYQLHYKALDAIYPLIDWTAD